MFKANSFLAKGRTMIDWFRDIGYDQGQHESEQGSLVEGTLHYAGRKNRELHSPDKCAGYCSVVFFTMVTALFLGPHILLELLNIRDCLPYPLQLLH